MYRPDKAIVAQIRDRCIHLFGKTRGSSLLGDEASGLPNEGTLQSLSHKTMRCLNLLIYLEQAAAVCAVNVLPRKPHAKLGNYIDMS